MDANDSHAISSLFRKLADAERQAPPRDAEAEAFIRDQISRQPGAPYMMAQTVIVQEQALNAAQARIEELERQANEAPASGGGLLGSLFGGGSRARGSVPSTGPRDASAYGSSQHGAQGGYGAQPAYNNAQASSPWGQRMGGGGGGFLAGAAQTAMGVAGGVLLGNAIAGMFDGNEANAAETTNNDSQDNDAHAENTADDSGNDFDMGGMDEI